MSTFKIIGFNILQGCSPVIKKALKVNTYYPLDSRYEASYSEEKEITSLLLRKNTNHNQSIFSSNDLDISISAIVGQNGSGKSSLLELLYACSFLLGEKYDYIEDLKWKDKERNPEQVITQKEISIANDLFSLKENALFEIYFTKGKSIYRIVNDGCEPIHTQEVKNNNWAKIENETLDKLFYSICVNYSLYGLNETIQPWLSSLFHKNDGYKTPLVINPYRSRGNIDVNKELHLAQTRTILNLCNSSEKHPEIVNNKRVSKVRFVIDVAENNTLENYKGVSFEFKDVIKNQGDQFEIFEAFNKISKLICKKTLTPEEIKDLKEEQELDLTIEIITKFKSFPTAISRPIRVKYEMIKYAVKKMYKICVQYPDEYQDFLDQKNNSYKAPPRIVDINGLVKRLADDNSHITLKLRQVIISVFSNYFNDAEWFTIPYYKDTSKESIATELEWIQVNEMINKSEKIFNLHLNDRMSLVPAALVKPVLLVEPESDNEPYEYSTLSSGEQHLSNTINNITYHIYNLNSVHHSGDNNRLKYGFINIVFDEVELYFHPEFQRIFIYELLKALKKVKHDKISGVNILFSTHSPFILSDIPASNILRLIKGKPQGEPKQTFAANIYDLLNDDFYLRNGVIGEFAKKKINSLLEKKNISDDDLSLIDLIGDPLLKGVVNEKVNKKLMNKKLIEKQIQELENKLKNNVSD